MKYSARVAQILEPVSKMILQRHDRALEPQIVKQVSGDRARSLWARPEVERARRRTEVRREPFSPTTQSHGLRSRSQPKGVLKSVLVTLVLSCGTVSSVMAQGPVDAEQTFVAMLTNATLEGTWAPVQQGRLGDEHGGDSYRIARVEKSPEGKWSVFYVFTMRDRTVEFPIPIDVKFAGDAAVMILDNVRAGRGNANWSARVMFHEDVYVGRWWETGNPEHGGTIAGTVVRDGEDGQPEATAATDDSNKLYELRIYTTNDGKLPALHTRFRDHTMRLFEKHGMENIVYWSVAEAARGEAEIAGNQLVYIIAHKNEAVREASWNAFVNDPQWQRVAAESERDGKILAEPPRSILMKATDFSEVIKPNKDSDAAPRLFELRQYNDGPDRVPGTVDRFASGEKNLFTKHGMETVSFWRATDDSAFIYLLAHKDRETARESWQGFFPDFRQFMEEYRSRTRAEATQSGQQQQRRGGGSEVRYLVPTDYSPLK